MAPRAATPALVALVAWAAQRAPLDQMPRRSSVALAELAATPGLRDRALLARQAQLAHRAAALAVLAARAAPVALVGIAARAALAAVVVLGRAALVAWALRAQAALVAVAARAALDSMRAA